MTLTREDLVQKCPICGGSGIAPAASAGKRAWRQDGPCQECIRGEVPTETGQAVLSFVRQFQHHRE